MKKNLCPVRAAVFWSVTALLFTQLTVSAQTLTHRYSFFNEPDGSTTATDVVASANGILNPNTVIGGDANISSGQLLLDGTVGTYVQLPAGVITNDQAVTIEVWGDYPDASISGNQGNWANLFDFGTQDANGQDSYSISFCVNVSGTAGELDAAISDYDNANVNRENLQTSDTPLNGLTDAHLAIVFDPPQHYSAIYLNGQLIDQRTIASTITPGIKDIDNLVGADNWGDPTLVANLDEFRIWNGALNSLQVAADYIAGPAVTNASAGTVTNIQLNVAYQMVLNGIQDATVTAEATGLTNAVDITELSTYSSGNTNILTVSNNVISAIAEGSATIIAQYAGVSATQTITVVQPVSTLTHRYSFFNAADGATTAVDSIGGANGVLDGDANITGGQLVLDGTNGTYLDLPAGIINSNYTAVTIDAWASFGSPLAVGMFFDFGNTDVNGVGEDYIFCSAQTARAAITASDPGYSAEQGVDTTSWAGSTNLHVTAVYNPPGQYVAIYTNGNLAASVTGVTDPISVVNDVESFIGRSLYTADGWLTANIDEFRIFNGALSSQDVAISQAAGDASIPGTVTNGPGALVSLSFKAPATLTVLTAGSAKLLVNYANLTNFDLLGNSITPPAGLTVTSSDTNVLTYASGGVIYGKGSGTAKLTVVYQGTTNTASITVVNPPAPTLMHRYSFFNEPDGSLTATDSIAGFNGTLQGSASITGGQLVIPNTAQTAPAPDYLLLPNGILTNAVDGIGTNLNDPAVTVEAWASFAPSQGYWAALFDFGFTDGSGLGAYDIHLGQLGGNTVFGISDSDNANVDYQSDTAGNLRGQSNVHIVTVFNPPEGYIACYTNGVLAAVDNSITISMAGVWGTLNKIGGDLWPDPGMQGSVSEFRIYNGVMSPSEVAQTQVLGPTNLLTVVTAGPTLGAVMSGGNLIISWPQSATGYTLQSRSSLTSGTWTNVSGTPSVVGNNYQLSVPISGASQFYRLEN
ncbi:MAG: LamG-like jellyroll fold domain-containing protein [Verrucomicrobiota bacterium]